MNKKGFTLIELLAVIVILAIIALIATPIILGIIDNAKHSSKERSIELYADSLKQAFARYQIENPTAKVTELEISTGESGKTYVGIGEDIIEVEYDGNVSCETIEVYEDGNVYLDDCTVNGEKIDYSYSTNSATNNNTGSVTPDDKEEASSKNGTVVYYDVLNGNINCTNYHSDNSLSEYNGVTKTTENQTSCLKFYMFEDTNESTNLKLLLDHNTTERSYLAFGNGDEFSEALSNLNSATESWNKENILDIRLISADEIFNIIGKENNNEESISLSGFSWLWANSNYWTSTKTGAGKTLCYNSMCDASGGYFASAWYISSTGELIKRVDSGTGFYFGLDPYQAHLPNIGIRPVIEIKNN